MKYIFIVNKETEEKYMASVKDVFKNSLCAELYPIELDEGKLYIYLWNQTSDTISEEKYSLLPSILEDDKDSKLEMGDFVTYQDDLYCVAGFIKEDSYICQMKDSSINGSVWYPDVISCCDQFISVLLAGVDDTLDLNGPATTATRTSIKKVDKKYITRIKKENEKLLKGKLDKLNKNYEGYFPSKNKKKKEIDIDRRLIL